MRTPDTIASLRARRDELQERYDWLGGDSNWAEDRSTYNRLVNLEYEIEQVDAEIVRLEGEQVEQAA